MSSVESESGCGFSEINTATCETSSPTDSSPLGGLLRKPCKKSLSQLHEQLLKKVGCVVPSVDPLDSSCSQSLADFSQRSASLTSKDQLPLADSSPSSSVVSLDLPSHHSPVEPGVCKDQVQNGKHPSGCDEGGEKNCAGDKVIVSLNGGLETVSQISEQSDDSGHGKGSSNDRAKMNPLLSEDKQADLDSNQVVQSNYTSKSCEEFSASAFAENNIGELVGKERSKSRKASKPMKRGLEEQDDKLLKVEDLHVEISFAKMLAVRCNSCTFTCCTNDQLSVHESTSHCAVPNSTLPFMCRVCKHATDLRDVFERHVAHHTGQHTVRYYQCPYCCYDTNDMMSIESHITEFHASENFRFEVTQNTISYLERLLECPVCHGLYQWRNDFLSHLQASHSLESLVSYLEMSFNEQSSPTSLSAPQSLFNGLLELQHDVKDKCKPMVAADDEAADAEVVEYEDMEQGQWSNDTVDFELSDRRSEESGLSILFHCSACDFSSENCNLYQQHLRTHVTTSACEDKQTASNSGSLVISAGATNLLNGGLLGMKGVAKTLYQCHLCPFECLKQVHYRRHLAIHERNERLTEGYRCGYCHFAHNRLNCVKFHLGKYHSKHPIKLFRIVDGSVVELSETDLYALRSRRSNGMSASMVEMPSARKMWSLSEHDLTGDGLLTGLEHVNDVMLMEDQDLMLASSDNDHLDVFEQQLPPSMIYANPVKCPKCDFTNRVRINLIKHLKLHKDEMDPDGAIASIDGLSTAQPDVASLTAGVYHAQSDTGSSNNAHIKVETTKSQLESPGKAREKTLLRQILSEKPMSLKSAATDDDVDEDEIVNAFEEREVTRSSQLSAQQQQDYGEFCAKLLNTELYQCHRCDFTNRFPSKVKRHFYYRHAKVPPYRCGHCPFEAVERGKVARHSQLVHRSLPVVVVQQEVEIVPLSERDAANHQSTAVFEPSLSDASNDVLTKITDVASIFGIKEEQLDLDCEAPLIDYYPKLEAGTWNEDSPSGRNSSETRSLSESQGSHAEAESSSHRLHTGSRMCRRQFRCGHCGVVSRWNRRDIILHVMHVHLRRRVFTCRHCSFGNSKSKALVRAHCIKFHPQRAVSVRDDTALLNAIMANEGPDGVVTMAFAPYGAPMVDSQELANYLHEYKQNSNETTKDLKSAKQQSVDVEDNDELPEDIDNCDFDITTVEREMTGAENQQLMKALKMPTELCGDDKRPWRCRLCGFMHSRVVRVKYHIICRHLKVKPFCCPYCKLYLWKSQAVLSHVDKCHPGCRRHALATVDEQASFLRRNIERMSSSAMPQLSRATSSTPTSTSTKLSSVKVTGSSSSRPGLFRCKLCGYQDARNDKTKYHIVKQHLKLRQFSCPYCHVYLWGRQQVAKHVEEQHPGFEIRIQRTFHEYEEFLRNNICRVDSAQAGKSKLSSRAPALSMKSVPENHLVTLNRTSTLVSRLPCDLCSFVTDSELSLSAHRRSHRLFQCAHCRFRHALVAKVQSHCLSAHPSKPVHYKQWTPTAPPVLSPSVHVVANDKLISEAGNDATVLKFYPCDLCPAHFGSQSALDSHVVQMHYGVFMCQHCRLVTSDKESMEKHQQDDHVFRVPSFEVICPQKIADTTSSFTAVKKQVSDVSGMSAVPPPVKPDSNDSATFKCRLCHYGCTKLTVMRHHVMSHLRYHPFICPYCSLVRSVKSFPIKKHVRLKHPGSEERVLYVQNDVLEKKVKVSFYRVKKLQTEVSEIGYDDKNDIEDEDDVQVIDEDLDEQPPPLVKEISRDSPPISQTGQHKVLYRCKMCGLKTHIRMDMRHHLMREIHYKPYKCAYCSYTEPCRWSMRKHFRTRHAGIEVALTDLRDPEQDRRVEQLVEECTIPLKDTSDVLAWKPQQTRSRSNIATQVTNFVPIKPGSIKGPSSDSKPVVTSGASLRLHRCTQCSYTTSNLKLLRGHIVKHGPYRLQCAYCDYRGHYPSRIYKHIRRHHRGCTYRVVKVNDGVVLPPPVTTVLKEPMKHHKRAKPLPGTVYLDGVALNLLVAPDQQGRFQCEECEYQTTNREHYKMHVVIHRPPKWQCFYCYQKYPLVFRLRRHSHAKHPDKPIKWIDLQSGQVCVDLQRNPETAVIQPSASAVPAPVVKATARKSTSKASMKVALFRSALFNKKNASQKRDIEEAQSDGDDFLIIDESDSNASSKDDYDDSSVDESVARPAASILRFCCHLCPFSVLALSPSTLSQHLSEAHAELSCLPTVEILPANDQESGDDEAVLALYRCGLCMFESFVREDFDVHVLDLHGLNRPFACDICEDFASFSSAAIAQHSVIAHSCQDPQVAMLDKPYTMVAQDSGSGGYVQKGGSFYNFEAFVPLEDISKLTEDEVSRLLLSFEVTSADFYV